MSCPYSLAGVHLHLHNRIIEIHMHTIVPIVIGCDTFQVSLAACPLTFTQSNHQPPSPLLRQKKIDLQFPNPDTIATSTPTVSTWARLSISICFSLSWTEQGRGAKRGVIGQSTVRGCPAALCRSLALPTPYNSSRYSS